MKSILVTGGSGFIGSHTCLTLLLKGYYIYVLDSLINSSLLSIERVRKLYKLESPIFDNSINLIQGDIRNKEVIESVFIQSKLEDKPIEGVIHFAGLKSVSDSTLNPLLYWEVNLRGTINLLNVMEDFQCRTIVYSSSATVYSPKDNAPLYEKSSINPINPYGQTKYSNEILLNDVFNSNPDKWRISILRYFNPIGSHPSGEIGESPIGVPNNIFPHLCQVAQGKIDKLKIFGSDWPTKDGTGIRDYIHVMDLAEGHLAALECLLSEEPQALTVNLGRGEGTSVLELVKTFERVNKSNINYVFTDRRAGDCASLFANIDLAKSRLNWCPRKNLEDMCRDGWNWQKNNPNGYI